MPTPLKALCSLLAVLCVSATAAAQNYRPLPANSDWYHVSTFCDGISNFEAIRLNGDVSSPGGAEAIVRYCTNSDSIVEKAHARYVADSTNSKLWLQTNNVANNTLVGNPNEKGILIMDLNLNVGDTFNIQYGRELSSFRIDNRDITVARIGTFGDDRKMIVFNEGLNICDFRPIDTIRFIEGVGPNYGFYQVYNFPATLIPSELAMLYYVEQNGESVYFDTFGIFRDSKTIEDNRQAGDDYSGRLECGDPTSTKNATAEFPVRIPNPLYGDKTIPLGELRGTLSAYTIDGRLLGTLPEASGRVSLPGLRNYRGIAVLRLDDPRDGRVYVTRVVVR